MNIIFEKIIDQLYCFYKKHIMKQSHLHMNRKNNLVKKWCGYFCKKHNMSFYSFNDICPLCFLNKSRKK